MNIDLSAKEYFAVDYATREAKTIKQAFSNVLQVIIKEKLVQEHLKNSNNDDNIADKLGKSLGYKIAILDSNEMIEKSVAGVFKSKDSDILYYLENNNLAVPIQLYKVDVTIREGIDDKKLSLAKELVSNNTYYTLKSGNEVEKAIDLKFKDFFQKHSDIGVSNLKEKFNLLWVNGLIKEDDIEIVQDGYQYSMKDRDQVQVRGIANVEVRHLAQQLENTKANEMFNYIMKSIDRIDEIEDDLNSAELIKIIQELEDVSARGDEFLKNVDLDKRFNMDWERYYTKEIKYEVFSKGDLPKNSIFVKKSIDEVGLIDSFIAEVVANNDFKDAFQITQKNLLQLGPILKKDRIPLYDAVKVYENEKDVSEKRIRNLSEVMELSRKKSMNKLQIKSYKRELARQTI